MWLRLDGGELEHGGGNGVRVRVGSSGGNGERERESAVQERRGAREGSSYPSSDCSRSLDGSRGGVGFALGRYSRRGERRPDGFALRPLEVSLVFAGRSFSLLFLFSFYFFSVFDLIEVANELQIL